MSDTYPNKYFKFFYDQKQIYTSLLQFMAIFSGMQVSIGKSDILTDKDVMYVPVRPGSRDRVVEWILAGQTDNKPLRVPIIAVKIIGFEMAPDLRKGMRQESAGTFLPRGGTMPDDFKTIRQKQPNPFRINFEVSVLTSNLKNKYEIMEQICTLFDPDIQIFSSDDFKDHYKIGKVELTGISLEEEYPLGQNDSLLTDTYQFYGVCYLRAPLDLKESYVKSVMLRLDAISDLSVEEAVIELNNYGNAGEILFDVDDMDIPEF
jgi:hypothetical protein